MARQEPDGVRIIISDDGKGLDTKKLLAKARERGLVGADRTPSEKEIMAFIFLQGFSTAQTVTNISGRGVGMEVVERSVKEIGGRIDIESRLGEGTRFVISVPTSLSIVDALIVRVDDERYAVPVGNVDEILDLGTLAEKDRVVSGGHFCLRDEILTFHDLSRQLNPKGLRGSPSSEANGATCRNRPILVVRGPGKRVGLAVDAITSQQQVVIRRLSDQLESVPGFAGGTILGDGEPGLILDVGYWASTLNAQQLGA
jgi:two-component system chemotaxis sensor kinase CheA